jgi:hypothetical protein
VASVALLPSRAFHVSGWVAAILTFVLPPFSEAYWNYDYYKVTGMFWSEIAIGSALYIALYPLMMIASAADRSIRVALTVSR